MSATNEAGDDWFRSADWGPKEQVRFEARLSRARKHNRPQYRRIKGLALLASGDLEAVIAGRALLRAVVADPQAPHSERVSALSLLSDHELGAGMLEEAEADLREVLALMQTSRSGSTSLEEVWLAEILIRRGRPRDLLEAERLLERSDAHRSIIVSVRFRFALVATRLALALGDRALAAQRARSALDVAGRRSSGLVNRPTLGLVSLDPATRTWLEGVVASGPDL